jgi:hypothetical protein
MAATGLVVKTCLLLFFTTVETDVTGENLWCI